MGPTSFAPLVKVWQAPHFLAASSPRNVGFESSGGRLHRRLKRSWHFTGCSGTAISYQAIAGRELRAGRKVQRDQEQAGAQDRAEYFVHFKGIHRVSLRRLAPYWC